MMGHTSLDMVSKVYVHLADQHDHLKGAVDRINPPSTRAAAAQGPGRKRALPLKATGPE